MSSLPFKKGALSYEFFLFPLYLFSPQSLSKFLFHCNASEGVKKLLQVERTGRDVKKVLQRYLSTLTTHNEKLR
jgi:hypothetical protein